MLHARQENTHGKEGSKHKRKKGEKWSAGYKELNLGAMCSPWRMTMGRNKKNESSRGNVIRRQVEATGVNPGFSVGFLIRSLVCAQ